MRYVTSKAVAKSLGIKVKSVSKKAKRHGIGKKVGGAYVFSEDEVLILLKDWRRK